MVNDKKHPFVSDVVARMKKGKVVSMQEAVKVIKDGDTVAMGGFVGIGFAEGVAIALEQRFIESASPKNLTLVYAAGQGDGKERGLNHLAHEGLIQRVIGGHWGLVPKLQQLAFANKISGYNFPQGVISHMFRNTAAKKPRVITSIGLGTFVDPRLEGGKVNSVTNEDFVEVINFDGKEYLSYKTIPIDIAIIRGTTADLDGNITMEKEALTLEALAMAMAAKNSGGFVIVQVERIAERGSLNCRQVKIPSILVDCVVVAEKPEHHMQTFLDAYNPGFSGEIRLPLSAVDPMPLNERKIIARRAAFELQANAVVNLGIGMPEGVANVATEEQIIEYITLTAEPGVIGGMPMGGLNFGAAINTDAIIDQPYQFDFYDGGGLDLAVLGLAQADKSGNLNVSKFGPKLAGCGGFINISQTAAKVVFVGTLTTGGLKVAVADGKLQIVQEGKVKKFVNKVEQVTFSAKYALSNNQPVYYVTERCVFELIESGLKLIEVAPGIDIDQEILAQMEFAPIITDTPRLMDPRIFSGAAMELKQELLAVPLERRLIYVAEQNTYFVNFEGYRVNSHEDIARIRQHTEAICKPLGKKVYAIVNYDNFSINPEMVDGYAEMVKYLVDNYYIDVTRYTTSLFMRMKLGDALQKRKVAPHIYETQAEAEQALQNRQN